MEQVKLSPHRNTTGAVLDAARDLHAQDQLVTREALAELTDLKLSLIDDRTRALVDDGHLYRAQRGVFVPTVVHPPARTMSKTILDDGWVKIEIGDEILTLTPKENRYLAELQAGALAQVTAIEAGRQAAVVHAELARRLLAAEREIRALRCKGNAAQMDLLADVGA